MNDFEDLKNRFEDRGNGIAGQKSYFEGLKNGFSG
jgi:hypothetical protein